MTTTQSHALPSSSACILVNAKPEDLQLIPEVNALSSLEVDLDEHLHFKKESLFLTEAKLITKKAENSVFSWELQSGLILKHYDHAGVGTLELHDPHQRLALWRYTLQIQAKYGK